MGQTFRGSPTAGPDELAHLRPPRGARARSALGPHLLPGSPTSPWLTSPTPRSGADNRLVGHGWAPPPARYARPRVGPGGHAGGGRYRTPRSAAGRRTVAFPALALEGLAPHLTGKGPRRAALHGPEGRPTRSDALRCPPHTGRSQADPAGLSANLRQQAPTCTRSPVRCWSQGVAGAPRSSFCA